MRRLRDGGLIGLLLFATVACGPRGPSPAQLAQQQQEREAIELGRQYDGAIARDDFALAQILGNLVLTRHPNSADALRIRPAFAEVGRRARAQRDHKRQADLWTYHAVPQADGNGSVNTGFIWAQADPGSRQSDVRLVLRNHPEWGLSAYLLIESGRGPSVGKGPPPPPAPAAALGAASPSASPYRCPDPACNISLSFDDQATQTFTAYQPDQAGTGALFIEEYARLVEGIGSSHWLRIDLPVAGGTRPIRFEVGGFVVSHLGASSIP